MIILFSIFFILLSCLTISLPSFFQSLNEPKLKLPFTIHALLLIWYPLHQLLFGSFVEFHSVSGIFFLFLMSIGYHCLIFIVSKFSTILRWFQLAVLLPSSFFVLYIINPIFLSHSVLNTVGFNYFLGIVFLYGVISVLMLNIRLSELRNFKSYLVFKSTIYSMIFSLISLSAYLLVSLNYDISQFTFLLPLSFLLPFILINMKFFSDSKYVFFRNFIDQSVFCLLFSLLLGGLYITNMIIVDWVALPVLLNGIIFSSVIYFAFPKIMFLKEMILARLYPNSFILEDVFTDFTFQFSNILHLKQLSSQLVSYLSKNLSLESIQLYSYAGDLFRQSHTITNQFFQSNHAVIQSLFSDLVPYYDRAQMELMIRLGVLDISEFKECVDFFSTHQIELVFPVKVHGYHMIYLIIHKRKDCLYSVDEKQFLSNVTNYLSAVFQNAIYYQKLMFNKDLMDLSNEFALQLNELMTTSQLYRIWETYCDRIFSSDIVMVFEKDDSEWNCSFLSDSVRSLFSDEEMRTYYPFVEKFNSLYESTYQFYRGRGEGVDYEKMKVFYDAFQAKSSLHFYIVEPNGRQLLVCCFFKSISKSLPVSQYLINDILLQLFQVSSLNTRQFLRLKDTQLYNEMILEQLLTPVILLDLDLCIKGVNRSAERLLSKKIWSLITKPFNTLLEVSNEFQIILNHLKEGDNKNFEFRFNRNGTELIFLVSIVSLSSSSSGYVIVFTDITDQRLLEQQVRHVSHQSSLGTLAAGVAHEIKNPLVAIRTFTQLLFQKYGNEGFKDRYMSIVPPQIDRISNLCESLVQLGAPIVPTKASVFFDELLEKVFVLGKLFANDKRKLINVENAPDLELFVDNDQFEQVILNLLLNAIESLIDFDNPFIKVRANQVSDEFTEISIEDNGCGIEPDRIPHLFDPFYTTKVTGTGLGMSVVHQIIKAHDGEITVRSRVDQGTLFKIVIPRR